MSSLDNAVLFLQLNKLPYWRVEYRGKIAFKSPESEEEDSKGKPPSMEESIQFFSSNMELYDSGHYTLIGRRKFSSTNAEMRFYFSKGGSEESTNNNRQNNNSGIGGIPQETMQTLIDSKLEKLTAEFELKKTQFMHEMEMKKLKEEIKESKREPVGLDKIGEVLGQVNNLLMLSKGKPSIGSKLAGTAGPVRTTVTTTTNSPVGEETELNAEADKIYNAMENIKSVAGDDLGNDLEAIANFAKTNPAQYQQYINMLKANGGR